MNISFSSYGSIRNDTTHLRVRLSLAHLSQEIFGNFASNTHFSFSTELPARPTIIFYFQWTRVLDTADPILDHTLKRLSLEDPEIGDLSPRKLVEFGKSVNVESLIGDITEPRERILSILRNKSLAFVVICRKNRSFVIGSRSVLQVFPERSGKLIASLAGVAM